MEKIKNSIVLLLLLLYACNSPKGLIMPPTSTIKINPSDTEKDIVIKAAHIVPTANQYAAQKREFIAFIHFGPNTFTKMEWGTGMEDPKIFALQSLDTDQWCAAMQEAGMKLVILTVKHHDGFCLWQSRYTKHGIMSSPFKNGKGDILMELSRSCQKYGIKLGVYLSPADLYQIESPEGLYGNLSKATERIIPKPISGRPFANKTTFKFMVDDYNEYFLNQLFELLTEYGPIHEVWFDGAHPKRKGNQQYNYLAWKKLIHTLAPEAVIFGKQDIRWCGNESGKTRDTEFNVIPYQNDPVNMNNFKDLTEIQLAERPQLYDANFLHYQMAETNTSIREGWFYRDEEEQKVRSADDVFDIYERSVGGNSIFLLNIPPNREGTFSSRDVEVLREVGSRIKNTYNHNLLEGAIAPVEILDEDEKTYKLLSEKDNSIIIQTKEPITINRFLIQEGVATHGERIESHRLSYWKNGVWKEIIKSSNVGYKRILRFPTVTASKFKLEVLKSRFPPALSKVAAFYYHPRPPQLTIQRNSEGMVTIAPKKNNFKWKPHGEDVHKNLYSAYTITYTDDESTPTHKSLVYKGPFYVSSGTIKARFISGEEEGSITSVHFGSLQKKWIPVSSSEEYSEHPATLAFDGDRTTYWKSKKGKGAFLSIDLGEELVVTAIGYTPPAEDKTGMIESGQILISQDGKNWIEKSKFSFGNLINDPTSRQLIFDLSFSTRYLKIEVERIAKDHENACIAEWDVYVKE